MKIIVGLSMYVCLFVCWGRIVCWKVDEEWGVSIVCLKVVEEWGVSICLFEGGWSVGEESVWDEVDDFEEDFVCFFLNFIVLF